MLKTSLCCKHRDWRVKVSFSFCCLIILILIIRVLIRGDVSAIFILYFHKIEKVYTALSKFWNYNVYRFLYFSNDNKYFLNYFKSHNLAKKNKKKFLLKKINFYHRSEFLQKKETNKTKGMCIFTFLSTKIKKMIMILLFEICLFRSKTLYKDCFPYFLMLIT